MQTIFGAGYQVALIVAALLCLSDLLLSTARFVQSVRKKRPAERDVLGRRWLPQILLAALVFGYAGAVLSRVVRTPGPGGRRFRLRAGLLLGLPALFGLVFGLSAF